MDQLRKAGQAIRDMDNAYAEKVRNAVKGAPSAISVPVSIGAGMPVTYRPEPSTPDEIRSSSRRPMTDEEVKNHQGKEVLLGNGIIGLNATARYVVPTAAAGLALKGAVDMATMLSQQTPTTLEPN